MKSTHLPLFSYQYINPSSTNHLETIWHLSPGFIINVWQSSDLHSGAIVDLQGFHGHAADGKSWLKATKCEPQKSFCKATKMLLLLWKTQSGDFSVFFFTTSRHLFCTHLPKITWCFDPNRPCHVLFFAPVVTPTNTELFKVGKDLRCWSHGRFLYQLQYCLRMEETKKYDYLISIAKKNTANIPIPHSHSL